jgi:hypothetical protein
MWIGAVRNVVVVVVISAIFWLLSAFLFFAFMEQVVFERTFTVYWGWFSWNVVLEWLPLFLVGLLAAICTGLLVPEDAIVTCGVFAGLLMLLFELIFSESTWVELEEASSVLWVYNSMLPIMYVIGAVCGTMFVKNAKKQLTHALRWSVKHFGSVRRRSLGSRWTIFCA